MAHEQQQKFIYVIKKSLPVFFSQKKVLEIGSLDVNGSVRRHFSDCEYTGIDVAPGPGVDEVCQGQDFNRPDASFDVVISCEVMEHNPYWKETFANMIRLAQPGALVIMTCATTGRPEHGTARTSPDASPLTVAQGWNYYKNLTINDFKKAFPNLEKIFEHHDFFLERGNCDLYFFGIKRGHGNVKSRLWPLKWLSFKLKMKYLRKNIYKKKRHGPEQSEAPTT